MKDQYSFFDRLKCRVGLHHWDAGIGTLIGASPECVRCRKIRFKPVAQPAATRLIKGGKGSKEPQTAVTEAGTNP